MKDLSDFYVRYLDFLTAAVVRNVRTALPGYTVQSRTDTETLEVSFDFTTANEEATFRSNHVKFRIVDKIKGEIDFRGTTSRYPSEAGLLEIARDIVLKGTSGFVLNDSIKSILYSNELTDMPLESLLYIGISPTLGEGRNAGSPLRKSLKRLETGGDDDLQFPFLYVLTVLIIGVVTIGCLIDAGLRAGS